MRLLSEKELGHFRCSKCSSVLSRGPIFSGPIRAPVCGRCVPDSRDVPNLPLEAFLRTYMFPCIYRENGCEEILPFNDKRHENQCRFKDNIESSFEIIDKSVWRYWKCSLCYNLLTVGPLSLNQDGKSICGRCIRRRQEEQAKETLTRNWKLEFVIKQLPLPCMHNDLGCERALKWGEVQQHEECCSHRLYSCPITPYDSCDSVIPASQLYIHFQQEHEKYILTNPKFCENLDQDGDTNRLLRVENHVLLLMSRVRINENRMRFSAVLVSDTNTSASKMQFVFKVSNQQETLHVPFSSEILKPDMMLRQNPEKAIDVSIGGIKRHFKAPNLKKVVCSLTIEKCTELESKSENLRSCTWNDCEAFGTEGAIKRHETKCGNKWIFCKSDNCKKEYPRCEMPSHESKCEERTRNCQFSDCDVKCSGRNWNVHIRDCEHSFTEEWNCGICYDLGCGGDSGLFPPHLLAQHCLAEHPKDIYEGPTCRRIIKNKKIDWIYFQYDGLLFKGYCWFKSYRTIDFELWLVGDVDLRSQYKYRFKVVHPRDSRKSIAEEEEMNNCNSISRDALTPFIKHNSIKIEFTIIKK